MMNKSENYLNGNPFYGWFGICLELVGLYLMIDVNPQIAIGCAFCISADKIIKRGFNNA